MFWFFFFCCLKKGLLKISKIVIGWFYLFFWVVFIFVFLCLVMWVGILWKVIVSFCFLFFFNSFCLLVWCFIFVFRVYWIVSFSWCGKMCCIFCLLGCICCIVLLCLLLINGYWMNFIFMLMVRIKILIFGIRWLVCFLCFFIFLWVWKIIGVIVIELFRK